MASHNEILLCNIYNNEIRCKNKIYNEGRLYCHVHEININRTIYNAANKRDIVTLNDNIRKMNLPNNHNTLISPDYYKSEIGNSALSIASMKGYLDIVNILLEANADPNLTNYRGYTPLMYAAMNGNLYITHRLLNIVKNKIAVVDINIYNLNNETALDLAKEKSDPDPDTEGLQWYKDECANMIEKATLATTIDFDELITLIENNYNLYNTLDINAWTYRLQYNTRIALLNWYNIKQIDEYACFATLYIGSGQSEINEFANIRWITGGAKSNPRSGAYGLWPIRYKIVSLLVYPANVRNISTNIYKSLINLI